GRAGPGRARTGRRAAGGQWPTPQPRPAAAVGQRAGRPPRGRDPLPPRRPAPHHPVEDATMIRRSTGALLALALALQPAHPAIAQAAGSDAPQALNVRNADLRAFIEDVARATGTTFIVDPGVQGTVNYTNDQPLGQSELLGVLLTILRANGLVAVPAGPATYRVVPDDTAAQQPRTAGAG